MSVEARFATEKLQNSLSTFGTQLRIQRFRWNLNWTPNGSETGFELRLCYAVNSAVQKWGDDVSTARVTSTTARWCQQWLDGSARVVSTWAAEVSNDSAGRFGCTGRIRIGLNWKIQTRTFWSGRVVREFDNLNPTTKWIRIWKLQPRSVLPLSPEN